jgi:hypothetical protein
MGVWWGLEAGRHLLWEFKFYSSDSEEPLKSFKPRYDVVSSYFKINTQCHCGKWASAGRPHVQARMVKI